MEFFIGAYAGFGARSACGATGRAFVALLFLVALDLVVLRRLELPLTADVLDLVTGALLRIAAGAALAYFFAKKWAIPQSNSILISTSCPDRQNCN